MVLISPSFYENLRKLQEKKPYYRNENASDYKNQLNDEKIVSDQIKEKQDLEQKKKVVSEFLKPVISDALMSHQSLSDKQRIRELLILLDGLSNIQISNEDIIIDGKKVPLDNLVKDLLNEQASNFSYDLDIVLNALLTAKVNPSLIKNIHIKKKLIELEKEEARQSRAGDDSSDEPSPTSSRYTPFQGDHPPLLASSHLTSPEQKPDIQHVKLPRPSAVSSESSPYIQQVELPRPSAKSSPLPQPNFDNVDDDEVEIQPQPFKVQAQPSLPPLTENGGQHTSRDSVVRPKSVNSPRAAPPQPRQRTPLPASRELPINQFPFASSKKIKRTPPAKTKRTPPATQRKDASESPPRKSSRDVPKPQKYGKGAFAWEQF